MEQKQTQLDSLPGSTSDFWEHAEVNTNIVPQLVHSFSRHFFVRVKGHEAQCTHCDWGFVLDPGDYVKDGHLFDKQGNLVI